MLKKIWQIFFVNKKKMIEESGSVSNYCEKNSLNPAIVNRIDGAKIIKPNTKAHQTKERLEELGVGKDIKVTEVEEA